MSPRSLTIPALLAVVALCVGCGPKPLPKPPEPPATTAEPEVKPPPPKCEKLDEKCEAKPDTRAKIAHSDLLATPVAGWTYAQLDAATVAQSSDAGPALAYVGFAAEKDAKKDAAARDAALADALKELGIDPGKPPKKVPWKSPKAPQAIGDLKLDLWELSGWSRAKKKGTLVVVAGTVADGKGVIAVSFAPDDDKSADDAIVKSFESIGPSK